MKGVREAGKKTGKEKPARSQPPPNQARTRLNQSEPNAQQRRAAFLQLCSPPLSCAHLGAGSMGHFRQPLKAPPACSQRLDIRHGRGRCSSLRVGLVLAATNPTLSEEPTPAVRAVALAVVLVVQGGAGAEQLLQAPPPASTGNGEVAAEAGRSAHQPKGCDSGQPVRWWWMGGQMICASATALCRYCLIPPEGCHGLAHYISKLFRS